MLAWSKTEDNQRLLKAIRGIAFFGVPRDGMEIGEIGSLIPMVERGPNGGFVGSLSRINSQILAMKRRDFQNALGVEGESEIVCFYETLQSPTAQTVGEDSPYTPTSHCFCDRLILPGRKWEMGLDGAVSGACNQVFGNALPSMGR